MRPIDRWTIGPVLVLSLASLHCNRLSSEMEYHRKRLDSIGRGVDAVLHQKWSGGASAELRGDCYEVAISQSYDDLPFTGDGIADLAATLRSLDTYLRGAGLYLHHDGLVMTAGAQREGTKLPPHALNYALVTPSGYDKSDMTVGTEDTAAQVTAVYGDRANDRTILLLTIGLDRLHRCMSVHVFAHATGGNVASSSVPAPRLEMDLDGRPV